MTHQLFRTRSRVLCIAVAALTSGCATFETATQNSNGREPLVYSGTRYDAALLSGDAVALAPFDRQGCQPPPYPAGLDLPLSFVADTVLLPATAFYALVGPKGN